MKTKKQIPYIWLGPVITLGIMLVLFALAGVYPFGKMSTAVSDGIAQYVPFLCELSDKIKEGGSLFFSWHTGGTNFWTTIAYYLTSPLNVIALFFPESEMANAFSLITLLKPALCALTFAVFLKHTYKKNSLMIAAFSALWGLSSFYIATMSITSWFDAIIFFPLTIWGLQRMMEGKSAILYTLFLGLTISMNFYIGWMVCIFCVIYFIYTFIADDEVAYEGVTAQAEKTDDEETGINIFEIFKNSYLLGSVFKFGFASLLGGAISAILTVPTYLALQNTNKGTVEHLTFTPSGEGALGILGSLVIPTKSTFTTIDSKDCLFVFVGVITVILAVAYFFTKGITLRKKLGNLFLIAVMAVSIAVYGVYLVWHGFSQPEGLIYRFAFIIAFILIKIAYEAVIEIKNIKWYGVLAGGVFAGICLSLGKLSVTLSSSVSTAKTVIIAVFIVIYTALLIIYIKKPKLSAVFTAILLVCIITESVVLNNGNILTRDNTPDLSEGTVIEQTKNYLNFGEKLHFESKTQTFNNAMLYNYIYGYSGWEEYSSLAQGDFSLTIGSLGSNSNTMNLQSGASEQTPVFNALFPTAYYLDGSGRLSESFARTAVKEFDGYTLYKNNYTMPFMYTVPVDMVDWKPFSYPVVADCVNSGFKYLTATTEDVVSYNTAENFIFENVNRISVAEKNEYSDEFLDEGHNHAHDHGDVNAALDEFYERKMANIPYEIIDKSKEAFITFDSVAQTDGVAYIYADALEFRELTVTVNGKTNTYELYGKGVDRIYEIGEMKKGDKATITIGGSSGLTDANGNYYVLDKSSFGASVFTVDEAVFKAGYQKLDNMSDTTLEALEDTYVKAKVTVNEQSALYIPTPYDGGWTVYIDGKETETFPLESGMMIVPISLGEHTVEMKYCPQGFTAGAVITGVSLVILIAWAVISKKRNDKIKIQEIADGNVSEE